MIDQIRIKIGVWSNATSRQEALDGLYRLSSVRMAGNVSRAPRFFQHRRPRRQYLRQYIKLKGTGAGEGNSGSAPLVSGVLTSQYAYASGMRGVQSNEEGRVTNSLDGFFNVNRWIMAQIPVVADDGQILCQMPFAQAIQRQPDWWENEVPYVPHNNIIIGRDDRFGYARSKLAEEHLRDYLSETLTTLTSNLRQFDLCSQDSEPREFVLGDIEFYNEFRAVDPITLVETLKHFLTAICFEYGTNYVNIRDGEADVLSATENSSAFIRSSPCFWFKIRQGVRFKVYAKTNRRVRFEICFSKDYRPADVPRRTFASLEHLLDGVTALKVHAVELMNGVLSDGMTNLEIEEHALTTSDLVNLVCSKADTPEIAYAILSELRASRRVAPFPSDVRYPTLRRLKTSGILQYPASTKKVFRITPMYRQAAMYPQPPTF